MSSPPGPAAAGTRVAGVVAALCLVQFVDVLGVTVVVTALPQMLADVGGAPRDGTLVATGYAMFFGGLLMFGARLGDRLGHRRTILLSLAVFAVGSLLAAVAPSVVALTAGRCVQGAAAAAAVPSALRLLTSIAPDERTRARAVAAWSAAGAAAGAAGFVVGGLVTAVTTWRVIFWGLLVMAAVQAVAIAALVPRDPRSVARRTPVNAGGSALLTAAVMLLVVGTTLLAEDGHRLPGALLVAAALAVAAGFVAADRRAAAPLLPAPLMRRPQVLRGTGGSFVNTATTSGVATLITLYLQNTLGRTPLEAAATLLPLSVSVILGSAVAARLVVRRPREQVSAAGLALIGLGIAVPLLAPTVAVLLGAGMAVVGAGLGLAAVATTSLGTDVDESHRATSSGLINTSAQLGTAIGTALVILLAAATTGVPAEGTDTPVVAWLAAAAVALMAAAVFARLPTGTDRAPTTRMNGHA